METSELEDVLRRRPAPLPGEAPLSIADPESSIRKLSELNDLGVQIAVDDFGTGYSSLEYLRRLPVDCVKIDRSFVRGLPDSSQDAAIVTAVIELGHTLKLSVTAEGVETQEQLGTLQDAGCDTAHGFLFYRPAPPDQVARLFAVTRGTPWGSCPGLRADG